MLVDSVTHSPSALLWWYSAGVGLFLVFPILLQLAVAFAGLRGWRRHDIFAFGLAYALVQMVVILWVGIFLLSFRLHFVFLILRASSGGCPTQEGVRMLGAGFWALLSGLLVCAGSNLAQLVRRKPLVAPGTMPIAERRDGPRVPPWA
jgi:hypothetical protein